MFEGFDWQYLEPISRGALWTIALCLVSGSLGVVLGAILGLAGTSPIKVLRWLVTIYVTIVRGIPLLIVIFFIYFGLPLMFPGANIPGFLTGVIALTAYSAAYIAEIFRGSIDAVPKGQFEAADALGLGYADKNRFVILPQALRIAVPPGIGFLINLVKESSLITVIGFIELMRSGTIVSNLSGDPITSYLVVSVYYFVICFGISRLGKLYEIRTGTAINPLKRTRAVKQLEKEA